MPPLALYETVYEGNAGTDAVSQTPYEADGPVGALVPPVFVNVTQMSFEAAALPLIEYVPVNVPLPPLAEVPKGLSVTLPPPDEAFIS